MDEVRITIPGVIHLHSVDVNFTMTIKHKLLMAKCAKSYVCCLINKINVQKQLHETLLIIHETGP